MQKAKIVNLGVQKCSWDHKSWWRVVNLQKISIIMMKMAKIGTVENGLLREVHKLGDFTVL